MTAGVVVLAVILFAVWVDPSTKTQVDSAHLGPYVVTRVTSGIREFLTYVDIGQGMNTDWRQEWTPLPEEAWKYAEASSAIADAVISNGEALPLKEVL
jgi:hypothetical protein